MMVSKILFVGVTVRSSFRWLPLCASLYMWNLSIVFKCLPFLKVYDLHGVVYVSK